jgi:hypothetical protein
MTGWMRVVGAGCASRTALPHAVNAKQATIAESFPLIANLIPDAAKEIPAISE